MAGSRLHSRDLRQDAFLAISGATGQKNQLEPCTRSYCEGHKKVFAFSKPFIVQENPRTTDGNQGMKVNCI